MKTIKKDKEVYHTFRKMKGWKNPTDLSKFNYHGTDGVYEVYTYEDITIKIKKSPKEGAGGVTLEQNLEK